MCFITSFWLTFYKLSPLGCYMKLTIREFVCWVLRLLTKQHCTKHLEAALSFLSWYENNPNILNCVLTSDEMWVYYVTPTTKTSTMIWKKKEEPTPKKCYIEKSVWKQMVMVFWDRQGVLLIESISLYNLWKLLQLFRQALKSHKKPDTWTFVTKPSVSQQCMTTYVPLLSPTSKILIEDF